jgi:hypothetical protein
LHPLKEEDTSSSKHTKVNDFLTAAKFDAESQDMVVMYALVCNVGKEALAFKFDDYPPEIQQLLWDFKELVGDELPQGLPLIRSIQHAF